MDELRAHPCLVVSGEGERLDSGEVHIGQRISHFGTRIGRRRIRARAEEVLADGAVEILVEIEGSLLVAIVGRLSFRLRRVVRASHSSVLDGPPRRRPNTRSPPPPASHLDERDDPGSGQRRWYRFAPRSSSNTAEKSWLSPALASRVASGVDRAAEADQEAVARRRPYSTAGGAGPASTTLTVEPAKLRW
jgi:hypothetical protein